MSGTEDRLRHLLSGIDGKGYKAYKDIQGAYHFKTFDLYVDHVQGDPFAAPSKIRLRVPMKRAAFPPDLLTEGVRRLALTDYVVRQVHKSLSTGGGKARGSGKSGLLSIDAGGQEVLDRTACKITPDWVEARIYAGLPAAGRKILGREAERLFLDHIPRVVERGLLWRNFSQGAAEAFVACVENQESIRSRLNSLGLVAFVADGSLLPRESGNSQRPLSPSDAVLFKSPESLRIAMDLPHPVPEPFGSGRTVTGMGIPRGITLIAGGGYHGKSTLLRALERGVYPHIPEDGREYVVTSREAVKIRAEDGRSIEQVDISPFITNLPFGLDTRQFSTDNASGSTSQAANIIEALEMGAEVLLLDEDTSATNFMIRDVRMQELVHKSLEPITPFIDRVREIYEGFGVSTVLVMGGCGDYFDVADRVILMREYVPQDVTLQARQVAQAHATGRHQETGPCEQWRLNRSPVPQSMDPSRGKKGVKIDAKALDLILFGTHPIDLRGVEQLVDFSQTRAVGMALHLAASRFMDGKRSLKEILARVEGYLNEQGLDVLDPYHRSGMHPGSFARPRSFEMAAALNRLRSVRFCSSG
ncbi:MAG: ABC-ATPase domain-containing protein [Deltaproteobacteria bacterium]|nr:ABC-ATPase domain-containing protein [Deltaproteobacteria bacterium]